MQVVPSLLNGNTEDISNFPIYEKEPIHENGFGPNGKI